MLLVRRVCNTTSPFRREAIAVVVVPVGARGCPVGGSEPKVWIRCVWGRRFGIAHCRLDMRLQLAMVQCAVRSA